MRYRLIIGVGVVLFFLAITNVAVVNADFNIYHRIFRDSACSSGANEADPVNVLFWNYGDQDSTLIHFGQHVGWGFDNTGTPMYLRHHSQFCQQATADKASDGWWANRDHIRFFNVNDRDPVLGLWTAASVHFDQLGWCPGPGGVPILTHIGRSFNIERDNLMAMFAQAGHHSTERIQWVDPYEILLCSGEREPVDGLLGKISIPYTPPTAVRLTSFSAHADDSSLVRLAVGLAVSAGLTVAAWQFFRRR